MSVFADWTRAGLLLHAAVDSIAGREIEPVAGPTQLEDCDAPPPPRAVRYHRTQFALSTERIH
jgi:hypothetical protein